MEWFHFAYKSSLLPPLWQDMESVPGETDESSFMNRAGHHRVYSLAIE